MSKNDSVSKKTPQVKPANLEIDWLHWLQKHDQKLCCILLACIVGGFLIFQLHWMAGFAVFIAMMLVIVFSSQRIIKDRELLKKGIPLTAIVDSDDPSTLLVIACMAQKAPTKHTDYKKIYAVKRIPASNIEPHSYEVGSLVPCVAHFSESDGSRWTEFAPIPLCHATNDADKLNQFIEELVQKDIDFLDKMLEEDTVPEAIDETVFVKDLTKRSCSKQAEEEVEEVEEEDTEDEK